MRGSYPEYYCNILFYFKLKQIKLILFFQLYLKFEIVDTVLDA